MPSNSQRFLNLLKKYIADSCSPQELEEFWQLLSELTDDEGLSVGLQDAWRQQVNAGGNKETWDRIYQQLHTKMVSHTRAEGRNRQTIRLRKYALRIVAAAVTGVLIMGAYLLFRQPSLNEYQNIRHALTIRTTATPMRVVTLPDGTVVTLRQNSEIIYDSLFGQNNIRQVQLKGEAFFDVAHDQKKPFFITMDNYTVKVLGTAFNVKMGTGKLEVAVTRGKVQVEESATHQALGILTSGNQLTIDSALTEKKPVMATQVNTDSVAGWVRQDIVFDNVTWEAAAEIIGSRYGVELMFQHPALGTCRFTGDFNNKSLADCLDIICLLTHTTWRKEGLNRIWVDGEGCGQKSGNNKQT